MFCFQEGKLDYQTAKVGKATKNVIDFLFRKWNIFIRFPSGKKLPVDPGVSNWANFIIKWSNHTFFSKFKELLRPCILFLVHLKIEIFQKTSFFCLVAFMDSFPTACWLCLRLRLARVIKSE